MNKKVFRALALLFLPGVCMNILAEGTSVGGHVKLIVYDRPSGESNGNHSSNYIGFAFRSLYLYISQSLNDKVSVDLQPQWSASTGATPRLGSPVAKKNDPADIETGFSGFVKAQINVLLPHDIEMGFGIVKPRFSWDYGAELFWEDQVNAGKFTANTDLGAVHDGGFEFYRNFELGDISLPAYLYILNGGFEIADNNNQPGILATVEPELGSLKFKLSLNYSKWDAKKENSAMKYLFGTMYETGPFSARAEYAAGNKTKSVIATDSDGNPVSADDAKVSGYYAKVFYRFAPWGRAMLHYDHVKYDYSGAFISPDGSEKYNTFIPGLQLYLSNSSVIQVQYDIADWSRVRGTREDNLKFKRLTIGWRTTF